MKARHRRVVVAGAVCALAAAAHASRCKRPYYAQNPFVGAGKTVHVGCLDAAGCSVVFSPAGCGCDGACVSAPREIEYGMNRLEAPEEVIDDAASMVLGAGVCSDGQISVHRDGLARKEWGRASLAGTKFVFSLAERYGQPAICTLSALKETALVEYEVVGSKHPVRGTAQVQSFSSVQLYPLYVDHQLVTFRSDSPIVVACWRGIDISGQVQGSDYTILEPISSEAVFGWHSTSQVVTHVDCDTLQPIEDEPFYCASSNGSDSCEFQTLQNGVYGRSGGAMHYSGPAYQINGTHDNHCVASYTLADADGKDLSSFFPLKRFTKTAIIPENIGHIAILSFDSSGGASCTLTTPTGQTEEMVTTGENQHLKRAYMSFASNSLYPGGFFPGNSTIECTDPVLINVDVNHFEQTLLGIEPEELWQEFRDSQCPPTLSPVISPTVAPTGLPLGITNTTSSSPSSARPSASPSRSPSASPSDSPTASPTALPTASPTASPTSSPTVSPTTSPATSPTASPTTNPTTSPTTNPTTSPTTSPAASPTTSPTASPTTSPTASPTTNSTASPAATPAATPTTSPIRTPTVSPIAKNASVAPSSAPSTVSPAASPSLSPVYSLGSPQPEKEAGSDSQQNSEDDDMITKIAILTLAGFGGLVFLCAIFAFVLVRSKKKQQRPQRAFFDVTVQPPNSFNMQYHAQHNQFSPHAYS